MLYKLLEDFLKYFTVTSAHFNRDDVPKNISPTDLSIVSTQLGKELDYYDSVIKLPAFDSLLSNAIQDNLKQSSASIKSVFQQSKVTNPYKISDIQVNNLLKSFGFNFPLLPDISRQVLQKLVSSYKNKGTLNITNLLNTIIVGTRIIELLYVNDDPSFIGKTSISTSTGDIVPYTFRFPYSYTNNDIHWKLSLTDAKNYPYNYAMSPFYAQATIIDQQANIQTIIKIRTQAKIDYNIWNSDPSSYDSRKVLKIDPFPNTISYLDAYLFVKYCLSKLYNVNVKDRVGTNYMYYKDDLSTLPSDFKDAYLRDTSPTSWEFDTKLLEFKVDPIMIVPDSKVSQFEDAVVESNVYEYAVGNNDIYSVLYTVSQDSNGNPVSSSVNILDYNNPLIKVSIPFPEIIHNATIVPTISKVYIFGGTDTSNNDIGYYYTIDLENHTIIKHDGSINLSKSSVVNLHDLHYIVVKEGPCAGNVYKLKKGNLELVTKLNTKLDFSKIVAEPYMDNYCILFTRDIETNLVKVLLLEEDKYFVTDITCYLLQQSNYYELYRIYNSLLSDNLKVICNGNNVYIFDGQYYLSQVKFDFLYGPLHNRIVARNVSGLYQDAYTSELADNPNDVLLPNVTYDSKFINKDIVYPTYNITSSEVLNQEVQVSASSCYRLFINRTVDGKTDELWPFSFVNCDVCNPEFQVVPLIKDKQYDNDGIYDKYAKNNKLTLPHISDKNLADILKNQHYDLLTYDIFYKNGELVLPPVTCRTLREPEISSYCSVFYDSSKKYDKSFKYLVLKNKLPYYRNTSGNCLSSEFTPNNDNLSSVKGDLIDNDIYKYVKVPDYIAIIEYLLSARSDSQTPVDYVISFNNSLYTSFRLDSNNNVTMTMYYSYIKYKKITEKFDISYLCNNQSTSPLCWFINKSNLRHDKFLTDNQDLPIFNTTEELYNLLYKLSPANITYLDNTKQYFTALYGILYTFSKLTDSSNLLYLVNYDISDIVNFVTPIHSRSLYNGYLLVEDDPVLDLVPLSDNIKINPYKEVYDHIKISDYTNHSKSKLFNDKLVLIDGVKTKIIRSIKNQVIILYTLIHQFFEVKYEDSLLLPDNARHKNLKTELDNLTVSDSESSWIT